jgi:hypothetical protein
MMIPYIILSLFSGLIMVRPHNARRPLYRELQQNANPADPADPENPNNHPPTNPNVVLVVYPSANANLNASQSEAALHQHQPPRSATRKQKQKQKNKKASVVNNYYYSCSHDSVSVHPCPHPLSHRPDSNFIPTLSSTPSTSSGGPTKKIHALMSLQLTKPVGYSFGSNYFQGRISKANAVKAALDKADTAQGPSQDKACATPFKAKVVCATPGTSILVLGECPDRLFLRPKTPGYLLGNPDPCSQLPGIYPKRLL